MGGKILEEKFCGVWGQMREEFLREKEPELYKSLMETKELEKYLEGYQRLYSNRAEKLAKELSEERGVTEELYQNDPLEWILQSEKIQEDIRAKLAEEIQK